eukprot:CAMPEP_0114256436 /NCGR_PEP_ID=MMETSP0058-20121206/18149_1 /TAXON_ID=36894 /ORGANISM="Pyramimonas parkeae, CCMP726" /LENGTH=50 /DNA_ID=CAMNT_0001370997 /DNA_START=108 /DNA_END=260 /DNA_ORIENTATION=-
MTHPHYQEVADKIGATIQTTLTDAKVFCGVNDKPFASAENLPATLKSKPG